ncbi:hypothetical protein KC675_03335 [Candidatus Dojkabacteria bacterium]|uniref:Uncharacterized protein n=1 Tax=Candidatus Dojkabacteria bacterium TaxID=2099670 RepID=A0A955I6Z8_9BACT|nr:hypothetical protein [Candidatus Dojkabacteria bacterium]
MGGETLDQNNLVPGQSGWLSTSAIRPSQPDDGRHIISDKPIWVDPNGVIVDGNHRYYGHIGTMDEMEVTVVDPT